MNNDGKYNICINICPCEECDWDEEDCILAQAYQKQIPKKPDEDDCIIRLMKGAVKDE